jgi:hypothetical protein
MTLWSAKVLVECVKNNMQEQISGAWYDVYVMGRISIEFLIILSLITEYDLQ